MPELPEVETVLRALEPTLLKQGVRDLIYTRPNIRYPLPHDLPEILKGQRFVQLLRRGKYILAFAESGDGFVLHLGMSGVIRIEEGVDADAPLQKHDHVMLNLDGDVRVVFNDPRRFGFLKQTHKDLWKQDAPFSKMGPEPLSNDFSGTVLAERLKGKKSPIKTALLNQNIVAGLGNIYVCEALYMSGISPERQAYTVQGVHAEKLAVAIKDVLRKAIDAGGSSLKDYKHTNGDLGYFQHQFCVYDRAGEVCKRCRQDGRDVPCINQIVQAGRSTYYCSVRQK